MLLKQVSVALERFQDGNPCEVCDGMIEVIVSCRSYLRTGDKCFLRNALKTLNYLRRTFGSSPN